MKDVLQYALFDLPHAQVQFEARVRQNYFRSEETSDRFYDECNGDNFVPCLRSFVL
jgi:hypothetical protein